MPTLQDVANRAGVSTATVSKVLSNTPYFTEKTRQKVMRAVEELGYVPNLAARALSTGRTNILAVAFPYIYDPIFKDPLVMQILEGIESEVTSRHYNLLLNTPRLSEAGPDPHYAQLINSGYVEGVIAIDSVPIASAAQVAIERDLPTVVLGYHAADYSVRSDDQHGGRLLMEYVLSLGHRRIGIITVQPHLNFAVNGRLQSLRSTAEQHGIPAASLPVAEGDFSTDSGAAAARHLLERHSDLTAIVCLNDRMAMGAIQYVHSTGGRVPQDISIVGYDDIPSAELFTPPLTTISQHASQLGRVAASMLLAVLDGDTPSPVVLPPDLIVRDSAAAPR